VQLLHLREGEELVRGRAAYLGAPARGRRRSQRISLQQPQIHHLFCKHCGVRPFSWGEDSGPGRRFYAVNIAALDDASAEELAAAPVSYVDGRHDDFRSPPAETRHL
jgi:hypothetical protein